MGYYTQYSLQVLEGDKDLIRQFRESDDNAMYALDEEGNTREECKWYESDDAMKSFSKLHPEVLFQMDGEGEGSGDTWRQYWKNGKCQDIKAELVYESYDESKLK